jgi:hypothetical protein
MFLAAERDRRDRRRRSPGGARSQTLRSRRQAGEERARAGADDSEQMRLRVAATRFVGALHGDPNRSRQARTRLKAKLARRQE